MRCLDVSRQHANHVHPLYASMVLSYLTMSLRCLSRAPKNRSTTRRRRSHHAGVGVPRLGTLGKNPDWRTACLISLESNPLSA